jgi:GGDEF domain-containing protein
MTETERVLDASDAAYLGLIDRSLSSTRWMPAIPAGLRAAFRAEGDRTRRPNNRRVILLLTLVFDFFWWPQWQSAPGIAMASAVLRLAAFTPAVLLFCALDLRGRLGWFYDLALLSLALAPCLITAYLCLNTREMLAQPEIYGTPLILLYTCILLRMHPLGVVANASISTGVYVGTVLVCPMLPHDQAGTVIFIQVAVATAVVIFNLQLETRDRRVFLLTQSERIRRAVVLEQYFGLLREAQTDGLTLLANRRHFDESLSIRWLLALQDGTPLSLIMIDVDHFKSYNDCYGHVMGDTCLQRVAEALTAGIRSTDLLARYGGEEFAVIISAGTPRLPPQAIAFG